MVQQNICICKMVEVKVSLSTSRRHWGTWEGTARAPLILNLDIRSREIKTALRPLYPRERTLVPICTSFALNLLSVFCEVDRRNSLAALPEGVNRYSEVNLGIIVKHLMETKDSVHHSPRSYFSFLPISSSQKILTAFSMWQ
jgi:hypothetical protein